MLGDFLSNNTGLIITYDVGSLENCTQAHNTASQQRNNNFGLHEVIKVKMVSVTHIFRLG